MADFAMNVIAIRERHPGASEDEIANLIQDYVNFESRLLELAMDYRREQYDQRMWMRFCHEYLRHELGLAHAFSDDVLDWLLVWVGVSIGEQDGEHDGSTSE